MRVEGVTRCYVRGGCQGQRSAILEMSWGVLYNWRDLGFLVPTSRLRIGKLKVIPYQVLPGIQKGIHS
jgi:hypothetical protein